MCVLRVTGKQLDVDRQLASSGLTPCKVFRKGEPRAWRPEGKLYEASGFTVDVSRGSWSNLAEQVDDAVAFLMQHEAALGALRSGTGRGGHAIGLPSQFAHRPGNGDGAV